MLTHAMPLTMSPPRARLATSDRKTPFQPLALSPKSANDPATAAKRSPSQRAWTRGASAAPAAAPTGGGPRRRRLAGLSAQQPASLWISQRGCAAARIVLSR